MSAQRRDKSDLNCERADCTNVLSGQEYCFFLSDIDDCASNPCINNAVCVDLGVNLYKCKCRPGYAGLNCDVGKTVKC